MARGGVHHLPRQPDRAGADAAGRPRRRQARHPVPGAVARLLRHPGREAAGAAARAGRLRLVRHPDLGRRRGDLHHRQRAVRRRHRRRAPAAAGHRPRPDPVFPRLLAAARGVHPLRHRVDPLAGAVGRAAADRDVPGAARLGLRRADGFGPMLSAPSKFAPGGERAGQFASVFWPSLTAMVGFWATLALNIPDFTRYARSQRDQVLGQVLGPAAADGAAGLHRRRGHLGHGADLRRGDLGPGGADRAHGRLRRGGRAGRAAAGDADHQPRRQRGRAGQRLLEPRAAADLVPHGRLHHRRHRHRDLPLEAARDHRRLHLHLADRLLGAAGPDRGDHAGRLLPHPAHRTRSRCAVPPRRRLRLPRRLEPGGAGRAGAGRRAQPAGLPQGGRIRGRGAGGLRDDLHLRVVRGTRGGGRRVPAADEVLGDPGTRSA